MNCRDMNALLDSNRPLTAEGQVHLRTCAACRGVWEGLEGPARQVLPPAGLSDEIRSLILGDLKPVKPIGPPWAYVLGFLLIFGVLAAWGVYRLGPDGWDDLTVGRRIGIFATLAASASLLGFSLVLQMTPGRSSPIPQAPLPAVLLVFLTLGAAALFRYEADPDFTLNGTVCMRIGMNYSAPAAFLFWLLLRRAAWLTPRATGAASGMLAGLVGVTVLEMHCPITGLNHLLVWHLGVAALGGVAGIVFGFFGEWLTTRNIRMRIRRRNLPASSAN